MYYFFKLPPPSLIIYNFRKKDIGVALTDITVDSTDIYVSGDDGNLLKLSQPQEWSEHDLNIEGWRVDWRLTGGEMINCLALFRNYSRIGKKTFVFVFMALGASQSSKKLALKIFLKPRFFFVEFLKSLQ